ncbi:hypothetical protein CNO14_04650 (plasmid) [Borrelia miyamotoi]|nr:hypothetical protein [Borrelia miyamotoi]AHH05592.1 hypothetical protein BOM_1049 [Borrelia miyamotoi FR64b]ATQ15356.2 hypothetical protein CNO14_04650 [Borrelia miyamotoi]ATQ21445.2 hypothetical protein CNO09_05040 [Borrelia miyamotoi]WAZ71044.1 hypothetical protein O5403_05150 [Borrelia miyamotoi]
MKYSDKINSEFIKDMKREIDWIKYNEDALVHLISQALISRSVSSLPRKGGLFNQNYWFVLIFSELNLYIKKLESESIGK